MDLRKGLVGHWTMDDADTSGGVLYDSSAYDNHGTINGGVTTSVSGKIGDAFDFDGSEGTGITMGLSSPPPTTLCGWVNLDSTSAEAVVVNNPGFVGQNLYVQSGDAIAEVILDNNDNSIQARSSVSTGNWYHLVAVLDSNSGQVELYVNGQEKSSQSWDGTYDGDSNIDNIGTDELNAPEQPLDGEIDDVRVYNRALSADEIIALYNMRSQRQQNVKPYKLRPKPGDPPNLMDATQWSVGTRGSQVDFSDNGGSQDNIIIKEDTPYGDIGPVWYGYSSDPSDNGSDGGWSWYKLNDTDIDESKPYRYSVWMKQESFDGSFYHGTERVDDFNGNHQGNPYYDNGNLPSTNDWYLVVGYNQPKSFDNQTYESGIYDINGNKVEDKPDYRWDIDGGGDGMRWRSYYYYDTTNNNRGVKFYDPRLEIIDGDHTSLTELFNAANDFSNRERKWYEQFDAGVFSPRWDVTTGDISSNRQYSGANSFGQWGGGSSVEATWEPFDGEKKISSFEYYWKEDSSQTGHVVILYDGNGNEVQESGTENYQWMLNNGSGGRFELSGNVSNGGYNNWTRFTFSFDWESGTYDYDMEDLEEGHRETGTNDLDNNTGVSKIRFTGAGYGSADYCRFDNIGINK